MPKDIPNPSAHNFIDLTGRRFGRLVVLKLIDRNVYEQLIWLCRCDCGKERKVHGSNLRSGATTSCGCSRIIHNKGRTPEYFAWHNMLERCENPKHAAFKSYGERVITVCERWHKLEDFLTDMGPRPDGYSIERIDNDGNYDPSNCKWATRSEQQKNKRRRHAPSNSSRST